MSPGKVFQIFAPTLKRPRLLCTFRGHRMEDKALRRAKQAAFSLARVLPGPVYSKGYEATGFNSDVFYAMLGELHHPAEYSKKGVEMTRFPGVLNTLRLWLGEGTS